VISVVTSESTNDAGQTRLVRRKYESPPVIWWGQTGFQ